MLLDRFSLGVILSAAAFFGGIAGAIAFIVIFIITANIFWLYCCIGSAIIFVIGIFGIRYVVH